MAKQSHFSQILSAIRFWKLSFNGLEMPFNIFKTSNSIPLYINNQSFYYILKIYLMFACKLYTFIFSTFLWNVCFLFYNLILKAHIFLLYFLKAHSSEFFNRAKCFPIDRNFPHLCWNIVVQLCFIACSFPRHMCLEYLPTLVTICQTDSTSVLPISVQFPAAVSVSVLASVYGNIVWVKRH